MMKKIMKMMVMKIMIINDDGDIYEKSFYLLSRNLKVF